MPLYLNGSVSVALQDHPHLINDQLCFLFELRTSGIKQKPAIHSQLDILSSKTDFHLIGDLILPKCFFYCLRTFFIFLQPLLLQHFFQCFRRLFKFFHALPICITVRNLTCTVYVLVKLIQLADTVADQDTVPYGGGAPVKYAESIIHGCHEFLKLRFLNTRHGKKHNEKAEQKVHQITECRHPRRRTRRWRIFLALCHYSSPPASPPAASLS